jgi:TonB-dependent Receptor Plug Domain/CarboxypepD_reg-like domain
MYTRTFLNSLLLVSTMLITEVVLAQGKFTGRVSDVQGEPLFGIIVVDTNNYSIIGQTDFDGLFTIQIPDANEHIFKLSLLGYEEIIEKVKVGSGQTFNKEFTMFEKSLLSNEVQIQAKAVRSADSYMEKIKMNSTTSIDYISSETIKKTGDANVISAITRISGVSTNGGLITVRGIGDRYVKTMLNGMRIPTLDPLTNNIKLDIFPASLVDNIVVTKTASPDLPSDWAGAYISVETKDYPDKLTVNVETQLGYNPQNTFKDFITSDRSKTDWLGFDNGLRSKTGSDIVAPVLTPSTYQELQALGLGDYYNSMGVTGWTDGSSLANHYFRLGLVQLGLLQPALINDQTAYNSAVQTYNSVYKPQAYRLINPNNTDYNNGFSNNWSTKFMKAPLAYSQNFSIGDQRSLFGKPFGYFFGFRYGTSYRYDPNGLSQRVRDASQDYLVDTQDETLISRETNSWSALLNLAYKLNDHNKVSFLFMPNIIGTNDVAAYTNIPLRDENGILDQEISARRNIFYEQRKQLIYQYSSQHFIPGWRMKIDANASYTDGASVAPDFRTTKYDVSYVNQQVVGYFFYPTVGEGIRRFYRYLDENIFDARLSAELPLSSDAKSDNKLKFGGSTLYNYRKVDNEEYRVMLGNGPVPALQSDDIDSYMSYDRFTMQDSLIDFYYVNLDYDRNHSFGYSRVDAGFAMVNWNFTPSLKFSGGLRAEHTDMFTDVDKFYRLGYERDDPRRANVANFPNVNPAILNRWDYLPMGSLIYKIENEGLGRVNVRFNYSHSLARPSIRELNDAAILDNEFRQFIYGNSDLQIARITNYDFRAESFFNNGDNVSVSLFYKDFKNHIEMGFGNVGITWDNVPKSNVVGVELEGKKAIGKHLEFRGNVTLVKSESQFVRKDFSIIEGKKFYLPIDTIYRPMFGQAPYLVNAMLVYTADSLGLTATVSYNVQGRRLVITGAFQGWPDVYEMPRNMIDFKLTKKFGSRFSVGLTVRDILNAAVRRSYDLPSGWFTYDSMRYGTTYLLSVGYKY